MSPHALRRLSDESLGRRLASGEAAAFDELHRRYVHRLAAYGAQLLGDATSGEDVAQASLLKAYAALRAGRFPETVRPWLYRIAHNCAIDAVARRRELLLELPDRPAPDHHPAAGDLVAALASLPDRQRHVFVLREVHGLRIDETATELDLAPAQVEQALFAARNRLAEHLVFGERLSCVAVRRLATGPLDASERRALKTHLRSCPACRQAVGSTGGLLGALPAGALDWLRALPGILAVGGAPAAVKAGAVVATAALATGAPIAYEAAKGAGASHTSGPLLASAPRARHALSGAHYRSEASAQHARSIQPVRRAPVVAVSDRTLHVAAVEPRDEASGAHTHASGTRADAESRSVDPSGHDGSSRESARETAGAAGHGESSGDDRSSTTVDAPSPSASPPAQSADAATMITHTEGGDAAGSGSMTPGDAASADGSAAADAGGLAGDGSTSAAWSNDRGGGSGGDGGGSASGDGQGAGD